MRAVHTVDEVRAAEAALMATLPEGVLMQRAAHPLSVHCEHLLGRVYGARVVLLVGSGSNGGDALFAGARLARLGARVHAVLLEPERAHVAGLAEIRRHSRWIHTEGRSRSTLDQIGRASCRERV